MTVTNTFQERLKLELADRCRKNPSYSMRSFARALQIHSSALAEMLSGKRTITRKTIEKIGPAMGLTENEIKDYINKTPPTTRTPKVNVISMFF